MWRVLIAVLLASAACDRCEQALASNARIAGVDASNGAVVIHLESDEPLCEPRCATALHAADNTISVLASGGQCGAGCSAARVDCRIGALPRGNYSVSINGGAPTFPVHVE